MSAKIRSAAFFLFIFCVFLSAFMILRHLLRRGQPNIILITIDSLRADHLGCYGYGRNTSPNIDKIAKSGVLFTQAITQSSHTAASNASLITSTYPNIHGVEDWGYQLSPFIPCTLPEILKRQGYATALISDQTSLPLINRLADGFDTFNTLQSYTFGPNVKKKKVVNITDWAIDWLRNNKHKKLFLWLYYLNPHGPYIPPYPYNKMFLNDRYYMPKRELPISEHPFKQFSIGAIPQYLVVDNIRDVNFYISQYDGEIRYVDEQIGRLWEELKKLHLDRNALIIINSDHSEGIGEHNEYFCHGTFLYDELIRIPLIIKFDKIIHQARKIDAQVRTIDIAPTILDILGITKYKFMQGNSLLPLLGGRRYAFPEFAYSEFLERKCVRAGGWKLIYNERNGHYELYDLKNDPAESHNLCAVEKDKFEFLKHKLDEYIGKPDAQYKIIKPALDKSEQEKMRSLGYVQ